ncbi:MAG TPA: YceI family protein, partial [Solirubrobacterales bacterium]|nr:YceI family protein [Solirubrobacterales bacterium]
MSTQTIQRQIPSGTHPVDRVHSTVAFAVKHAGVSTFRGDFESFEARLTGGERPSLEGTVDVGSIRVADEQLKGHLLSPEFFDAGEHSRLSFESSELEVAEDGAVELRGTLTIAGRSREVRASGRTAQVGSYLDGKPHIGLSLAASVDRRDFGLDWQAEL